MCPNCGKATCVCPVRADSKATAGTRIFGSSTAPPGQQGAPSLRLPLPLPVAAAGAVDASTAHG